MHYGVLLKNMYILKLTILTSLLFCSCNDVNESRIEGDSKSSGVTADELLQTLGGFTFEVKIDKPILDGQSCGLARKFADGSIKPMASTTGLKTGDIIKFVCLRPENGLFRYSLSTTDYGSSGSSSNFPKFMSLSSAPSGGSPLKIGETIARYSIDAEMSPGEELEGDDFDLIFYIQPVSKPDL